MMNWSKHVSGSTGMPDRILNEASHMLGPVDKVDSQTGQYLIHSCSLRGVAVARGDLTDEEWDVIGRLLPAERGRKSRPAHDNRRFLNGMLHVLRVGCPWRDMHERYGKWNSVYVRFRRWAEHGVWDAILATLVEFGLTDDWQHMIDSTTVRGHVSAAGAKGGLIRRLLVDHAAALRARSTPAATIKDALSASS